MSGLQALTGESRAALKEAMSSPMSANDIRKAGYTTGFGLINYDLQAPAKLIYPMYVPLRSRIPRVAGKGDLGTHWKSIIGINSSNLEAVTSEGNRGLVSTDLLESRSANYVTMGLDSYVTEEARLAAENFDDALQQSSFNLLNAFLIAEEKMLLGGNGTTALTRPTAAVLSASAGGGLNGTTQSVIVVALTAAGYRSATVTGGCPTTVSGTSGGPQGVSITYNAGTSRASPATTLAMSTNGTLAVTWAAVPGAVGYGVYWGTAGNEVLGQIVGVNTASLSAAATGTQNASVFASTDFSVNALAFDGINSIIANSYNAFKANTSPYGAYWKSLDGATLTPGGDGTVVEIENMLIDRWNNFQLGIDTLYVNAQQLKDIRMCVLTGSKGYPLARNDFDPQGDHSVVGGGAAYRYRSPYAKSETGNVIDICLHPNQPAGTMTGVSWKLPYSVSNVANPLEVKFQRDVWEVEWPQVRNTYDFSIFSRQLLADYATMSLCSIVNIGAGVTSIS